MFDLVQSGDPMRGVPATPLQVVRNPQADASSGWWGEIMRVRSSAPGEHGAATSQVRAGAADPGEHENVVTSSGAAVGPWPKELTGWVLGTPGWTEEEADAIRARPGEGFEMPHHVLLEGPPQSSSRARVANAAVGLLGLLSGAVQRVHSAWQSGEGSGDGQAPDNPVPGLAPVARVTPSGIETARLSGRSRREAIESARSETGGDAPVDTHAIDSAMPSPGHAAARLLAGLKPAVDRRSVMLRPIRSFLRERGGLPKDPTDAQVRQALNDVLYPLPDGSASFEVVRNQDDLLRELMGELGWAYARSTEGGVIDGATRRAMISELYAVFVLGSPSASEALTAALWQIGADRRRPAAEPAYLLDSGHPPGLRDALIAQLKKPGEVSESGESAALGSFVETLLPGIDQDVQADDPTVLGGSMRWCDHILAHAALRLADGARAGKLGSSDVSGLAMLAEQQAAEGNPAFAAQYRRLALAWAAMQPAEIEPPIDWSALVVGDDDSRQQAQAAVLAAFAEHRAGRWTNLAEQAEAAETLRNQADAPTRLQVAEASLKKAGLDPDRMISAGSNTIGVSPLEQRLAGGSLTEFVSVRDAYLSQNVARYGVALRAHVQREAKRQGKREIALPPIDGAYREAVQTFIDTVSTSLTPFVRQVIEHGNGPRDTESQWSPDASAAGATAAVRRQAAKDWLDGKYYTRADRDFLFESEIQQCDASLVTMPEGPIGPDAALLMMGESAAKPTSILLRAKHRNGEARDYLLWTQGDGTLAITRFAPDMDATNLHPADFKDVMPRAGRDPQAAIFRATQLDRLYDLSQGERDKLKERGWRISHRVQPVGPTLDRGRDDPARELAKAVMQTYRTRVVAKVNAAGYGETDLQAHARLTQQIVLSMIPFYDCVSSAVSGDVASAVPSCAFDGLSLIPVGAAGAGMAKVATRTAKGIGMGLAAKSAKGAAKNLPKHVIGVAEVQLAQARRPAFAALRHMGRELGEELLPLPAQLTLAAGRMQNLLRVGETVGAVIGENRKLIDGLASVPPETRRTLKQAFASAPQLDTVGEQTILRQGEMSWPVRRVAGTDADFAVLRTGSAGGARSRFVAVDPANGIARGPEWVETGNGELRPVARRVLPIEARTDVMAAVDKAPIQTVADVHRDAAGNTAPIIADLRALKLPRNPNALLLEIDGYPYVQRGNAFRRLTLREQRALRERSHSASGHDALIERDVEYVAANGAIRLSPTKGKQAKARSFTSLQDMLRPDGYYAQRYAADLSQDVALADLRPDINGLIHSGDLRYIKVADGDSPSPACYYRIDVARDGMMQIVHPQRPFAHPRIPVRYDAAAGLWKMPALRGLRGGQPNSDLDVTDFSEAQKAAPPRATGGSYGAVFADLDEGGTRVTYRLKDPRASRYVLQLFEPELGKTIDLDSNFYPAMEVTMAKLFRATGLDSPSMRLAENADSVMNQQAAALPSGRLYVASEYDGQFMDLGDFLLSEAGKGQILGEFKKDTLPYRSFEIQYNRLKGIHEDACAKQNRILGGRPFYELSGNDGDYLKAYKELDAARFDVLEKLNRMLPGSLMGQQEQHYLASRLIGNWDHLNFRMENFGYTKQGDKWVGKTVDFGTSGPLGFMGTPKSKGHGVADRQRPPALFDLPQTASVYDDFSKDVAPQLIGIGSQPYGRQSKTSIRRVEDAQRNARGNPQELAQLWQDPRYESALEIGYRLQRLSNDHVAEIIRRNWVDAPVEFDLTREEMTGTMLMRKQAMLDQIGKSTLDEWKENNPDRVKQIDREIDDALSELNLTPNAHPSAK
jgi:hypothetical protein